MEAVCLMEGLTGLQADRGQRVGGLFLGEGAETPMPGTNPLLWGALGGRLEL